MFQCLDNNLSLLGAQSLLDGNDQLRKDGKDPILANLNERCETLVCQEFVGVLSFSQAMKEDRHVVMIVQFLDLNDPACLSQCTHKVDHYGQIPSVIAHLEHCVWDHTKHNKG